MESLDAEWDLGKEDGLVKGDFTVTKGPLTPCSALLLFERGICSTERSTERLS